MGSTQDPLFGGASQGGGADMPKMKTHKGAKKRVKITASGKVVAMKTGKRHLNWKKSGKEIRQKGRKFVLAKPEAERIKLLLPYE